MFGSSQLPLLLSKDISVMGGNGVAYLMGLNVGMGAAANLSSGPIATGPGLQVRTGTIEDMGANRRSPGLFNARNAGRRDAAVAESRSFPG